MTPKLDEIIIYPIKSFRGFSCQYTNIENTGLRWDRQYIVTDCSGQLATNTNAHFLRFEIQLIHGNIKIIAPNGEALMFNTNDFSNYQEYAKIGENYFYSRIASIKINRWFSRYLQRDVQLRKLSEKAIRHICPFPILPLSFMIGYPVILINQSSVKYIAKHNMHRPTLSHIRGNLIIKGFPAFDERRWKILQIGVIQFDVITMQPPHYIIPANYPEIVLADKPLQSSPQFKSFCKVHRKEWALETYLIPRNSGTLVVGDTVQIHEFKTGTSYSIDTIQHKRITSNISVQSDENIYIEYQQSRFRGNSQQTILEQLEQQHINLPYSCRAGICGRCAVELSFGEVTPLVQNAIKANKKILACSCRPKGTIKIR